MLKLIATSLGTKIITAVASLLVVVMASHFLGAEKVGNISLIILSVTIFIQINNIIGGSALVYLVPRHNETTILVISYFWVIVTIIVSSVVVFLLKLVAPIYFWHTVILSTLFIFSNIHWLILLAKEYINKYNVLQIINSLILVSAFAFFIFIKHNLSVFSYLYALYFAYGISFLLSVFFLIHHLKWSPVSQIKPILKALFKFGGIMQAANLLQLFNYRFLYYLIEHILGKTMLGIYSVGNQLSEGVWLLSNSASTVLYPKITNHKDSQYALKITLSFAKGIAVITFVLIVILLIIPSSFYAFIFGQEFINVKYIIFSLSGGIFFLSLSKILSNYFSGIGKPQVNTIASGIGAFVLAVFGYWFISKWHLVGAGLIASITYFSSFLYQWIQIIRHNHLQFSDFKFTADDMLFFKQEVKRLFRKS